MEQGYSPQYLGFRSMHVVLMHTTADPQLIHSLMTVYALAAAELHTTPQCVEHNIRYLVTVRCNETFPAAAPRPSNKMLISQHTMQLLLHRETDARPEPPPHSL